MLWSSIMFMAWTMGSWGTWANPTQTVYPASQIGVVKNVFVGKLTCAARLLTINEIQTWCYKGSRKVWNAVTDLPAGGVVTIDYYDNKPNEPDAFIVWLVAFVENNPNTVAYQVSFCTDTTKPQSQLSGQF